MNKGLKRYRYIGPDHLRPLVSSPAQPIKTPDQLRSVLTSLGITQGSNEQTATFVVDLNGHLRLAPRRSEHVSCAGGNDVLSAGEITFDFSANEIIAEWVTNQSTGYCPEPSSWNAVEQALKQVGVVVTDGFSMPVIFRRCDNCRQISIVKDNHFECDVCGVQLHQTWNLG